MRGDADDSRPEHLLYELVNLPFYYNTIAFFMVGVLAVRGLRHFNSWSDIYVVTQPLERNFLCLNYTEDVLDQHIFA